MKRKSKPLPKIIREQRANRIRYKPKIRRFKAIFACDSLRALFDEIHAVPESGAAKKA